MSVLEILNCIPKLGDECWDPSRAVIIQLETVELSHGHGGHLPHVVLAFIDILELQMSSPSISGILKLPLNG